MPLLLQLRLGEENGQSRGRPRSPGESPSGAAMLHDVATCMRGAPRGRCRTAPLLGATLAAT